MKDDDTNFDSLHDGRLFGIHVDPTLRELRLDCRCKDGVAVSIELSRVVDLCADNLRLGNIILMIQVCDDARQLGVAARQALAQSERQEIVDRYFAALHAQAGEPPKYFLMQSSYGCDLVALFRGDVRLVRSPLGSTKP